MAKELNFRGNDLTRPVNRILAGFCALAVNVRAYLKGGFALRNPLTGVIYTLAAAIHTIRRLNDSTPNGPSSGYALVSGAGNTLYLDDTIVATGLSGNPVSLVPFRPNTSVQPWMYVGDSAPQGNVRIATKYLTTGAPVSFPTNGMLKVRSDGLIYKMGIKEPQVAPVVSTSDSDVTTNGTLQATAIPWTNYEGANPDYDYGETNGYPDPTPDGTAPFIVDVANASFITIESLTGQATINGGLKGPSSLGPSPSSSTNPGHFVMEKGSGTTPPATASVVIGAFTDGAGNVIPAGVAPLYIPAVVDVGAVIGVSEAIVVPYGAQSFQIGINSTGNTFSDNSGSFALSVTVTTNALPAVTSILGTLSLAYWGDSPSTGAVGTYIWKNSGDPSGSGPVRSSTSPNGSTSGNSFIFDATFTGGLPGLPGVGGGGVAMQWASMSPESVQTGSAPVFPTPLTTTYPNQTTYTNFNFSLSGNIYFPAPGDYTFVLTSHDDCIWGIGGGVTLVSATASGSGEGGIQLADSGQTLTPLNGYPLLPRQEYTHGDSGDYARATVVVNVAAAGIYPIELGFDFWGTGNTTADVGRILLLECSSTPGGEPTIIPPLPASIRQQVQYRYVYRSSATGATSNPSPESTPETVPVIANTITSVWSDDPQVDVVDYYRLDSTTADYTYVATGPNDDYGGGTNTPISDALTDTELGTQLLSGDNFEPFPSIDLPQKGTCSISGGVITWISGGAIGGTATGFNVRWLAGTEILIGSPTSLAYTFIARPTSDTGVTIPGVPDGENVAYEIPQPILANQPLPYLFGPTDNINFTFGVGDPLRPGTLYWCEGSNLDAAPDTNQQDVTDPSEPLVNGAMSAGRGVLFSIKRAWIIAPNFFNAQATATGTTGSQWSLKATAIDRGLFIPRCVAVEGGGKIFFRVDDGIHMSPGGGASKSITDETLYPLFSHEGSTPVPITRNGVTIYPPDDTQPQLQKFSQNNGYLYYDYQGTDTNPHTLVFDIAAGAWILDITTPAATIHASDEGESVQGCLVGCVDGSLCQFASTGTEAVTGTVLTAAIGGKGWMHFFEQTVEYSSAADCTLSFLAADEGNGSYGPPSVTLPSTGGSPTKYTFKVGPNKWKWLQFQLQSTDPTMAAYLEGFAIEAKAWGDSGPYKTMLPFASAGGEGAQP